MAYKIVITNVAEKDLNEIIDYISKKLFAPKAASEFLDKIELYYENIALNPLMFPSCESINLKHKNYRKAVLENYIMFYKVDDVNKTVYIMRFVYAKSDYFGII